jgi:hypothetical protein
MPAVRKPSDNKCVRSKEPQQVGVYAHMFDRLDSVIAAFESPDGTYHVYQIPLDKFKKFMRFREYENGDGGLMKRASFKDEGTLLRVIAANQMKLT